MVSKSALEDAKQLVLSAFDDNNDGRIDIAEVWYIRFPAISRLFEPKHDKTNKIICGTSEDTDQPVYPHALIRVLNRLHADTQADESSLDTHIIW